MDPKRAKQSSVNAGPLRVFVVTAIAGSESRSAAIVDPRKTSPLIKARIWDAGLTKLKASARIEEMIYKDGAHWVKIVDVKRDCETEVLSEQLTRDMIAAMRGR